VFESAESKNISVKLKGGSSRFFINNIDVLSSLSASNSTRQGSSSSASILDSSFQSQINQLKRSIRAQNSRILNLEQNGPVTNGSTNASNSNFVGDRQRFNRLNRRIASLEQRVANLTERLLKDHCKSYPCQNGGTCFNMFETFRCECTENWEGPMCSVDVNECAKYVGTDLGCQNGATCINTVGSYE
jgi:cubilin